MRASLLTFPIRRPLLTLGAALGVTLLLGAAAAQVRFDNAARAWLPTGDPELEEYRAFRAAFGEDAFLLVACDLDLLDRVAARWFLGLAGRIEALPGVARVVAPVASATLPEQHRAALSARLAAIDRAAATSPRSRELLLLQAEVHASLPFVLNLGRPEQALESLQAAQRAALAALYLIDPVLPAALVDPKGPAVAALLGGKEAAALAPVFLWGFARGGEVRASGGRPELLAGLPRVDEAMRWVLARDEAFFQGGAHLYFAMRLAALPRTHGGDPTRALEHFEAVRRLRGVEALLPRVLQAELIAPTLAATPAGASRAQIEAAQRAAWDALVFPLREVLAAPLDPDSRDPIGDAVARERAAELLADPAAAGVIPPADEPPAEPAPEAAASLSIDPLASVLVSADRRRAGLLVLPSPALDEAGRAGLVARVEEVLATQPPLVEGLERTLHLAGPDVITTSLDRGSQGSFGGLFPLVALAMVAVLYAALGSVRAALAVLAAGVACAVWVVGILVLSGAALNLLAVTIPAVLAVIASTYGIHMVSRYVEGTALAPGAARPERAAAWEDAVRATARPAFFCAMTTALGFLSLLTAAIPPVRQMGIFTALGTCLALVAAYTIVPALLVLVPVVPREAGRRWWDEARARRAAGALASRTHAVVLVGLLVAFLASFGVGLLRVESHVLRFFPPQHPLPRAVEWIEEALLGLTPIELWLSGPEEAVLSPAALERLDGIVEGVMHDPEESRLVTRPISPALLDDPALAGRLDTTSRAALLRAVVGSTDPTLASYAVRQGDVLHLRLTLACRTTSSDEFDRLVARLHEDVSKTAFPDGVQVRVTGAVPLLARVQVLLVEAQQRSFALSFLLVAVVVGLQVRSLGLAVLALVPSLLPILFTLGAMGWTGITLNTATVTVAGIALGLVVDDTIHFLHAWDGARRAGRAPLEAVGDVLSLLGRPIVATSAALSLGFGVFTFAPFRPTLFFGLLIAITALAALAAVLLLLPAILLLISGRRVG